MNYQILLIMTHRTILWSEEKRYYDFLHKVQQHYSFLENISINLVNKSLRGSAKSRWYPFLGYRILLNFDRLRKMNASALYGLFAHELAHIEQVAYFNSFQKIVWLMNILLHEKFSNSISKEIRSSEHKADIRAIELGFSRELLALKKFIEKNYTKQRLQEMKETYMSIKETKQYIH